MSIPPELSRLHCDSLFKKKRQRRRGKRSRRRTTTVPIKIETFQSESYWRNLRGENTSGEVCIHTLTEPGLFDTSRAMAKGSIATANKTGNAGIKVTKLPFRHISRLRCHVSVLFYFIVPAVDNGSDGLGGRPAPLSTVSPFISGDSGGEKSSTSFLTTDESRPAQTSSDL
ncbi:hypothetical protein ROHU_007939 [Labeo rohita]|uniref:Uncharacterized protein n=1 Tax=Labeo rohita TaxID=84645 RepID=A0A498MA83_LABRO|nr:hypothetical protein ROHU_007939 [Labeo rohita]